MGFYFRKSVSAGPIRFNFSKRGIGVSVGAKGLRYGVRADGQSYVSAGRYGFCYRKNLGGRKATRGSHASSTNRGDDPFSRGAAQAGWASSAVSSGETKDSLVYLLHRSAQRRAGRFLVYALASGGAVMALMLSPLLGMIGCAVAGWLMWFVGRWDARRRRIYLQFDPNGSAYHSFQRIITAFNALAACSRVHVITNATRLASLQEAKRHAGVGSLVDSVPIVLGEGSLPCVDTNVPIPTLLARGQTVHFLPDRVLVLSRGYIGEISYAELEMSAGGQQLVEDSAPVDSVVIGSTWLHPNVDGGPDRRFSQNWQLPICTYSAITMRSKHGVVLDLLASNPKVGPSFVTGFSDAQASAKRSALQRAPDDPYLGVPKEHFDSLPSALYDAISNRVRSLPAIGKRLMQQLDNRLARLAGRGNTIVHCFLRFLAAGVTGVAAVGLLFLMSMLSRW